MFKWKINGFFFYILIHFCFYENVDSFSIQTSSMMIHSFLLKKNNLMIITPTYSHAAQIPNLLRMAITIDNAKKKEQILFGSLSKIIKKYLPILQCYLKVLILLIIYIRTKKAVKKKMS